MKLLIAICDDEMTINTEVEQTLKNILGKLNIKYEIEPFYSANKFCKRLNEGRNYDLIFLDIEYEGEELNGVDVGKLIRKTHDNNSVSIVYISWERKYSLELHDLQPLNFLVKPINYEVIEKVITQHMKIFDVRSSYFSYKIGFESFKKQIRDIAYVESRDRKLILHLANGEQVEFYGTLKTEYKEQLEKYDFLFINAAYAVNFDFIARYTRETVIMEPGGAELSISQGKRSDVSRRHLAIESRRDG